MLGETDLFSLPRRDLRQIWGRRISYVAQDAALALNPVKRVSWLIAEPMGIHLGIGGAEAETRSVGLLDSVGIPDPEAALRRYPHQFSGGQQQRIALAIALSCEPEVLILDEPTTGLDVTTQAQISRLILEIVRRSDAAALYISHDLALLATICDEIAIMYAGEVMEQAPAAQLYSNATPPVHGCSDRLGAADRRRLSHGRDPGPPATSRDRRRVPLLGTLPVRCSIAAGRSILRLSSSAHGKAVRCLRTGEIDLAAQRVTVEHNRRTRLVGTSDADRDRSSLQLPPCRVGPGARRRRRSRSRSRPAKRSASSASRAPASRRSSGTIAGLHTPLGGEIRFEDALLEPRARDRSREVRQGIQIVFQNPDSSLNPRHTIGSIIERPLQLFFRELSRRERRARALELLHEVRLDPALIDRYPHQLSGGQKQRVALARAFAAEPRLILCDEVVSALDVSVQASILDLVARLAAEHHTAVLFVTHDLAVVRSIADRICVLQDGVVRETGETGTVFGTPEHAYTRELLSLGAAPRRRCAIRRVKNEQEAEMRCREIGNTGIEVSTIGFGAWAIGGGGWIEGWGAQDDDESIAAIHRAVELGINWIDTAGAYGLGHSEEVIARALEQTPAERPSAGLHEVHLDLGRRRQHRKPPEAQNPSASEVEGSLRRLRTDVLDLCQLHMPVPDEDIEEGWAALVDLQREGKVREIGVSNFDVPQMERAQSIAPITSRRSCIFMDMGLACSRR